jgi:hypothetical protein
LVVPAVAQGRPAQPVGMARAALPSGAFENATNVAVVNHDLLLSGCRFSIAVALL